MGSWGQETCGEIYSIPRILIKWIISLLREKTVLFLNRKKILIKKNHEQKSLFQAPRTIKTPTYCYCFTGPVLIFSKLWPLRNCSYRTWANQPLQCKASQGAKQHSELEVGFLSLGTDRKLLIISPCINLLRNKPRQNYAIQPFKQILTNLDFRTVRVLVHLPEAGVIFLLIYIWNFLLPVSFQMVTQTTSEPKS